MKQWKVPPCYVKFQLLSVNEFDNDSQNLIKRKKINGIVQNTFQSSSVLSKKDCLANFSENITNWKKTNKDANLSVQNEEENGNLFTPV